MKFCKSEKDRFPEKRFSNIFEKVVLLRFTELHGLHGEIKIIWKKLTPHRYHVQKKIKLKNGVKNGLF